VYEERALFSESDFGRRARLLASRGLGVPGNEDAVYGIFDPDGELAATGSLAGKIIEGVAVSDGFDGEGLSAKILTALIREAANRGIYHLFLFTKPDAAERFAALGFRLVAAADSSALLEWGRPGIEEFVSGLRLAAGAPMEGTGCVVANCNPFTLGHRYLIEQAAASSVRLFVIIVSEDRSEFSFDARFRMAREGTEDLPNVTVLSGGDYVVSGATFPSYFTKASELAAVHASLDLEIFASRIAPALGVGRRFVGTEPFSPVTKIYNETMKRVLPPRGVEVAEIPRLETAGAPVSASRVRALLSEGRMEEAKELVPLSTRRFFL
jgi:[citrate (pro-3S)-lyase] ligase